MQRVVQCDQSAGQCTSIVPLILFLHIHFDIEQLLER